MREKVTSNRGDESGTIIGLADSRHITTSCFTTNPLTCIIEFCVNAQVKMVLLFPYTNIWFKNNRIRASLLSNQSTNF